MKLFTAALLTETSDLTSIPLTKADWLIEKPADDISGASISRQVLLLFKKLAEERSWDVAESLCATGFPPGGRTVTSVYENMRSEIIQDLKAAMPVDIVLLNLHGAAMAHGYDDCEGDLLEHIRAIVGPDIPIGVELDPHCHVTEKMMRHATIMILYKTFLHTDIKERAAELFELIALTQAGEINPVMSLFDCKMIDGFNECYEPMKSFFSEVLRRESDKGILSISPVHGFPLADIPDMGSKMLVVADDDLEQAREVSVELGQAFFKTRGQMRAGKAALTEQLSLAQSRRRSGEMAVQLIEWSDLSGCGFPTDGTELVSAMLESDMCNMVVGLVWDPLAASICHTVGEGVEFQLRIGGKASSHSGVPLDLKVKVAKLHKNYIAKTWSGDLCLGDVAIVHSGETEFILVSYRRMAGGPKLFKELGVDINKKDYLVFKWVHDSDNAIDIFGTSFEYKSWDFNNIDRPKYPWDDVGFELLCD